MNNISAWAIRHPTLPIVLFVVLGFLGIVSFVRLPINLNPDVAFPLVTVSVSQPGAAPSEIETQVTQKIEGAVASVGNVRNINSRAIEGFTNVFVEFQIGTPVERAVSDVRDAVAKIRSDLPEGIQEPQVQRVDVEGGAIAYYAITSTAKTPEQLSWFVDDTVSKRLLAIPGVAQASRGGGVDRELRVELDPTRVQALGITAVEVNQLIRQLNLDAAGGRAQVGGGEQAIRVLGGARSADALGETQIALPGGRLVRLKDIAEVRDSVAEIRSMSRLNGRPATNFGVFKARGVSDVSTLDAVERELGTISAQSPDVDIRRVFTTVDNTRRAYESALVAMFEGSILAVLVVFVFLRDLRATAIAALAIPLSAIPTFAFMQSMGFTLNSISLLALSLVAGVLVDDAIVEIENIVRHMRMGKSGYRAALDAADEIGLAVVATSAVIIAVFLPVSFMGGFTGQYFKQFGLTVAAAVFFSLLVARLVTPLIAAYVLKPHDDIRTADGPTMARYQEMLRWCLEHRWTTISAGIVFLVVSVGLFVVIPKSFLPNPDFSTSQLTIELPPGVRLEETARISAIAASIVSRHPEVSDVVESIGGGDDGELRKATLYISLVPREDRKLSQKEWEDKVTPELARVPDARVGFAAQGGGGGRPLTFYLTGDDPALVEQSAQRVVAQMQALKELRDARIDGDLQRPEIIVRPRLDLAADLGVSVASIGQTIRIATIGDLPQNAAKFSLRDRQIPIRVSLVESSRRDFATLENLPVPTASGATVPLKAVADISFGQGPSTVRRYNQQRRVMIGADLNGVELGPAMAEGGRAAGAARPAAGRSPGEGRRCGVHEGAVRQLPVRDGGRRADGVRRAGAAVRARVPADHDPLGAAAVDRRRGARTDAGRQAVLDARGDRVPDADGHRRQEFDPAGRLRDRGDPGGQVAHRGTDRGRPQARAADRDDHGGDGRRNAAGGARHRRRQRLPLADGHRGDRRTDHLHGADAGDRAGAVHRDRRFRTLAGAEVLGHREPRGTGRKPAGRTRGPTGRLNYPWFRRVPRAGFGTGTGPSPDCRPRRRPARGRRASRAWMRDWREGFRNRRPRARDGRPQANPCDSGCRPAFRALHRARPFAAQCAGDVAGEAGFESALRLPVARHLRFGGPEADAEAREAGGAERGGLGDLRSHHGYAEHVGLELHQTGRWRWRRRRRAVRPAAVARPAAWPTAVRRSGRRSTRAPRARCGRVSCRGSSPTIVPRACGSQCGLPRPVNAGTR